MEQTMKRRGILLFSTGLAMALIFGWYLFPKILYSSTPQPLQFSHKVHAVDGAQACEECHAFRDDGSYAGIPALEKCAACHSAALGTTKAESLLVADFVLPGREIQWKRYARQPANVYFSHAPHVRLAKIACERCHGPQGSSDTLRVVQVDRISGYSRDLWGPSEIRLRAHEWDGMKMTDCSDCHHRRGIEESCLDCHK
jgi:hypothetical protein